MNVAKIRRILQPGKRISKKLVIKIVIIFLLSAGLLFPETSAGLLGNFCLSVCHSGLRPGNLVLPVSGQVLGPAQDGKNSFFQRFQLSSPVSAGAASSAAPLPAVYCNGAAVEFDVSPLFHQETPMFPLRGILEECGFTVTWDTVAKRAILLAPGRIIYISPGNPLFSVNGVVYRMSRPAGIIQGRIMVGLDFLQMSADRVALTWDENENVLCLKGNPASAGEPGQGSLPGEDEIREYDLNFVEVLLSPGDQAVAGENFQITVTAPFVQGVYAYAVRFSYNPEQIEMRELKNPSFSPGRDFAWQKIDPEAGTAEYLQTYLGYRDKLPPPDPLVILEAKALCAGELSLPGNMLEVTMLDNAASPMPLGLEGKTLRIDPSP